MNESNSAIDDSDYEDDSMESLTDKHEDSAQYRESKVIDDSDEEGTSSGRTSKSPANVDSLSDSIVKDRLSPLIARAIRRSIHQFTKPSSGEEDEDSDEEEEASNVAESSDSSDENPVANSTRRKRRVINDYSSDEELVSSGEDTKDSIQEFESLREEDQSAIKEQHSEQIHKENLADSVEESKDRHRIRSISISDSSDDDNSVSQSRPEPSGESIRESVKPEEQQIRRRPRDKDYEYRSEEDLSEDEDSQEEAYSSADQSKFFVAEGHRSRTEHLGHNNSTREIEVLEVPRKEPNDVVDILSSSDEKENDPGNTSETSMAISMAKEETMNTTIDPVLAQRRALLVYKQQKIQTELAKAKMIVRTGNMALLPDKGERLRESITKNEQDLAKISAELNELQLQQSTLIRPKVEVLKHAPMFKQDSLELDPTYLKPTIEMDAKELGRKAQETLQREQSLTVERLKDLHGSLLARPTEDEKANDPRGLKVPLMPHQQHALAWLLWREQQKPPGGVLADDMGLGKTLTMIALVMASMAKREAEGDSEDENEWRTSARSQKHLGGTLVVAPASLLAQWESEVNNRCKRGLLSVELYHGSNRESVPKRLAKTDIVVTTYNILSREFKSAGVLYKIRWRRIILDEAHVIRNHKSQTCEAVCGLHGNKRWALTGTPVHNKEMDLYSILKFLQCSPFDDLRVWKRWVDNKNAAGHERLATVMKTLMLRRTKAELQAKGTLESMPEKSVEVIEVTLDPEERLVYDKVMVYSRTLFAQFLAQRAEKAHMFELGAGKYDGPSWTTSYKETQFTKAQSKLLSLHADVKSHEILVLLLRLRQVCCHPHLINSMLDQEDIEQTALEDGGSDIDLLSKMNNMSIKAENEETEGDIGVDERVTQHLLTSDNPVFNPKRQSSKVRAVLAKVEEIMAKGDKMIIVSQWVGVLNTIADELESIKGASFRMFTGQVAVKDRQGIMDDFNSSRGKPNILLLSLTAGGVGLNLVGANHLFLVDIHWNPQLESQAQDRIYRFGQKKNVFIYKYICSDTIEERIKGLQEKKLELANAVLSGGGKAIGSKLSLEDIKSLFSL